MERVKKELAKLFVDDGNVSLTSLENLHSLEDTYIDTDVLNKQFLDKCQHLSKVVECNVGGFGTLKCVDENFHNECPFKKKHSELMQKKHLNS